MKRLIILVLLISVILCSCHAEIAEPSAESASSMPAAETDAIISEDIAAAETEPLSPVRTKLVYDRIVLNEKYPDLKTSAVFYFENDLLYVQAQKNENGEQLLHVFDTDGERVNMLTVPQIPDGIVVYAYPLHDGGWVIGYKPKKDNFSCRIALLDADGNLLRETASLEGGALDGSFYYSKEEISDNGESSLHIIVTTWYGLHCFDGNLKESFVQTPGHAGFQQLFVLSDDWYGVSPAIFTDAKCDKFNPSTGEIRSYSLQYPKFIGVKHFFRGADGHDYVSTDHEIMLLDPDRQPQTVLKFGDAGLDPSVQSVNQTKLKIGNRNTFANLEVGSGGDLVLYRTEAVQINDERQVIEIQSLHSSPSAWMTEMISRFNQQNTRYRVEIRDRNELLIDSVYVHEQTQALFNQILLYERHPDIVFCTTEEAITAHADKKIFWDLNTMLNTKLLSAVSECYSLGDALYQIPFMFHLDTLAANPSVIAGDLTYDTFIEILNGLQPGEILTEMIPTSIYQNALMDFVDYEEKRSMYNTETFRNVLRYIRNLNPGIINPNAGQLYLDQTYGETPCYILTNGTVSAALSDGALKFLNVSFYSPEAFSALKMIFGDTPYNLCGYPCLDGCGARIDAPLTCAVLYDTDVAEGCAEFLEFLLAEEQQTDEKLLGQYLPVTEQAMRAALEEYRYVYYNTASASMLASGNHTGNLYLTTAGHSSEYQPQFGGKGSTEEYYVVVETTDAEIDALMAFFDRCHMRANADPVIKSIVEEEVSFWEGNARTLEETTKIIDSRVWIYLNE